MNKHYLRLLWLTLAVHLSSLQNTCPCDIWSFSSRFHDYQLHKEKFWIICILSVFILSFAGLPIPKPRVNRSWVGLWLLWYLVSMVAGGYRRLVGEQQLVWTDTWSCPANCQCLQCYDRLHPQLYMSHCSSPLVLHSAANPCELLQYLCRRGMFLAVTYSTQNTEILHFK